MILLIGTTYELHPGMELPQANLTKLGNNPYGFQSHADMCSCAYDPYLKDGRIVDLGDQVHLEKITALNPDLIIASQTEVSATLEQSGVKGKTAYSSCHGKSRLPIGAARGCRFIMRSEITRTPVSSLCKSWKRILHGNCLQMLRLNNSALMKMFSAL